MASFVEHSELRLLQLTGRNVELNQQASKNPIDQKLKGLR